MKIFSGFFNIPDTGAETIFSVIKAVLLKLQLSLAYCRGQCYDGASNMLGHKTGVAKRIQDVQPKAHPTHCHRHSLSLSVKDTVKNCKLLLNTMDTAKEIVTLIKFSPKRERLLGDIKENLDEEHAAGGIITLCPTRWTVRASCFQRIIDNYSALLQEWIVCLDQKLQADVRGRVIGCEAQINTFDFFFGLNLGERLFFPIQITFPKHYKRQRCRQLVDNELPMLLNRSWRRCVITSALNHSMTQY